MAKATIHCPSLAYTEAMLASAAAFSPLRLAPTRAGARRSAAVITMRDRSKNRKPTQRGRYLSTEAIQAVQSLKRAALRGAPSAAAVPMEPTLRRLLKADMVAVFRELAAQGEALLALQDRGYCSREQYPRSSSSCRVVFPAVAHHFDDEDLIRGRNGTKRCRQWRRPWRSTTPLHAGKQQPTHQIAAVTRCAGQRRPTAVSRHAGVCGGPARVLAPPSPMARRQVPLAAVTIGSGSVKVPPPSSLVARRRLRALPPSALAVRRLVWVLPPSSLAARRWIRSQVTVSVGAGSSVPAFLAARQGTPLVHLLSAVCLAEVPAPGVLALLRRVRRNTGGRKFLASRRGPN
ncbi:hypothetical protein GUJ93_ZPchr0004g38798 [Zizania palustris]|uniref:Uncharacterized protein n=1 Tax=Zizania palustris TaxID=103762 RepID=A0A8J5SQ08_ZIZPA|nr:hypothetical protein GUJ93_ZPchr0004g38798 [Zizania palustris]